MLVKELPQKIVSQVSTGRNLFGEDIVLDNRPSAGKSAQLSGDFLEQIVYHTLLEKKKVMSYLDKELRIVKSPEYSCHFGLPRKGDFKIFIDNFSVHMEVKQLGNVESHFDKLSHCLMNATYRCYGNHFWLVYDYNKDCSFSAKNKIKSLVKTCVDLKRQVALQGITFELIHIDDLNGYLTSLTRGG